jgi:Protein of unknown function (DUF2844)
MRRASSAVLICLLLPATAFASLGGTIATVDADRVHMKAALVGITQSGPYTVHTILSPTGTTIREYFGASGVIFGVAWEGAWQPDLRQLFGAYFEPYQRAVQNARKARKARGQVAVDDGTVVVRIGGHPHSVAGIAYVSSLVPSGVDPGVVK